eukprot:TRINITY_DN49996_c0_g1_i1.p1 TRINITY_DN49996_c0_g1~~TRINITY_DN49996_c0_g1_i1.p1  ORF type:complete len:477 (+),score=116.50 TRINITY_DN49996_c0_g1_i1:29-1432(+)
MVPSFCLAATWWSLLSASASGSNCGVDVPRVPGAPDWQWQPLRSGNSDALDLEDQLFSELEGKEWSELLETCAGEASPCFAFGVEQWNLTNFHSLAQEGLRDGQRPCDEDFAAVPALCGDSAVCKLLEGKVRIVALKAAELTPEALKRWSKLPFLSALELRMSLLDQDFGALKLPSSVRVVMLEDLPSQAYSKVAPLLRGSGVRSLHLRPRQNRKHWTKVNLAHFCGLDLLHFTGFVIDVDGSAIPECWSKMKNLRSFYCSNCMMSSVPTALKGLQSLRSFVAFRQSEMVPCKVKTAKDPAACKASWETRHGFKEGGLRESSGEWGDFQEGPSFLCPESSFSFPFQEIVELGWSNVQKVWLDGNFLTGPIPENIAEMWPQLRSLDLYDNNLQGPIPQSLGQLPFVKLQLHDNNFSGTLPESVMSLAGRPQIVLGLSGNPHLQGCAPAAGEWQRGVPGTRITPCRGEL